MKVFILALPLLFFLSCAPIVCPDTEFIKATYSQEKTPKNYSAVLSVKYGPIKLPLFVEKKREEYLIRTSKSEILSYKGNEICINSVCVELPITPDGIIFGNVLKGDEKATCTKEGVVFEKDDFLYTRKYVFLDGNLKYIEILDKKRNKTITVRYGERTKDGYYESVELSLENLTLRIKTEEVKVF